MHLLLSLHKYLFKEQNELVVIIAVVAVAVVI
jgi:hypothetical protein